MYLTIATPEGTQTIQRSDAETVLIGRSSRCDVVIDDSRISSQHAALYGGVLLEDLDSKNGTFVAGERISKPTLIPGLPIHFGGNQVQVEVRPDSDSPHVSEIHREIAALQLRVHELEGSKRSTIDLPTRAHGATAQGETPMLEDLVRNDDKAHPPGPTATASEVFIFESFHFTRNAERIVAKIASELTFQLKLETQLPDRDGNLRRLLAGVVSDPGDQAARHALSEYLSAALGWLFATMHAYQCAAQRLVEELRDEVSAPRLRRRAKMPAHMKLLGLESLVLWSRSQQTVDTWTANWIMERLEGLAKAEATRYLESEHGSAQPKDSV